MGPCTLIHVQWHTASETGPKLGITQALLHWAQSDMPQSRAGHDFLNSTGSLVPVKVYLYKGAREFLGRFGIRSFVLHLHLPLMFRYLPPAQELVELAEDQSCQGS